MATADTWLNLYPSKILGFQDLQDHLTDSLRDGMVQVFSDIFGAGGMLNAKATLTVVADEFTLSADRNGYTPDGFRLELDASVAALWQDIPFEDSGATVYAIGATHIEVPTAAQTGTDGLPHFSYLTEQIGELFVPDSIAADAGGGLLITMTGGLPDGMKHATSTEERLCAVWFEDVNGDPFSGNTTLAIESVNLEEAAGVYTIVTSARFGQGAGFSTVPARYRVAVLGAIPYRSTELPGNWTTAYLPLGTITSGVFSNATAPLVNNFGATIVAFNVQHHPTTGLHLDVTADRIDVGTVLGSPSSAAGRLTAEDVQTNQIVGAEPTADAIANAHVVAGQLDGTAKVELRAGDPAASGGGGSLHFPNPQESSDNSCQIGTTRAGVVDLFLTNDQAVAQEMRLRIDGQVLKNPAKTSTRFALLADLGVADDLELENVGVGALNLKLIDGSITVDVGNVNLTAGDINALSGDVEADTFTGANWSADAAGVVDAAEFTAPVITLAPVAGDVAYGYSTRVEWNADYAPVLGGWTPVLVGGAGASYEYTASGGSQTIQPDVVGTNAVIRFPLNAVFNQARTTPIDKFDRLRLKDITIRYLRNAVGDVLILRLERLAKDGSGTGLIATMTMAVSVPITTQVSSLLDHVIDSDAFAYYLELTMNSSVAKADVQVANIDVRYDSLGLG